METPFLLFVSGCSELFPSHHTTTCSQSQWVSQNQIYVSVQTLSLGPQQHDGSAVNVRIGDKSSCFNSTVFCWIDQWCPPDWVVPLVLVLVLLVSVLVSVPVLSKLKGHRCRGRSSEEESNISKFMKGNDLGGESEEVVSFLWNGTDASEGPGEPFAVEAEGSL